ncbi:hypothetical protein IMZ48_05360 [Candidatus Bathyarchaeota archaeon]|nr:hypothetical protein [Candidatus Bathyarchaeota archaeon]
MNDLTLKLPSSQAAPSNNTITTPNQPTSLHGKSHMKRFPKSSTSDATFTPRMNNPAQIHTPLPQRHPSIPTAARPVQMDPSICHPVFFTDRLWKVPGAPGGPASPVSEGYVYRNPQTRPRNGGNGPRL